MDIRAALRRVELWPRRSLALLMLVLQVGIAIAPLAERDGRRTVTHAEQRGTRHTRAHNEETCALCAVRSLQAHIVRAHPAPTFRDVPRRLEIAYVGVVTSRDPPTVNGSRAPPPLS
jgi:hypothetical protein